MWEATFAIGISFAVAVRMALFVDQWRPQTNVSRHGPRSSLPLVFPHGCMNCRQHPVTVPWVYQGEPEAFACTQCQTDYLIHFIPGGVGIPPRYEWEERNPTQATPRKALVCNCPCCRGELTYYLEQRPNSPRATTARCRACGYSEVPPS